MVIVVYTDQKQEHTRRSDRADVTWEFKIHTAYASVFNLINCKIGYFKEKKRANNREP